jgi:hypothetical protein
VCVCVCVSVGGCVVCGCGWVCVLVSLHSGGDMCGTDLAALCNSPAVLLSHCPSCSDKRIRLWDVHDQGLTRILTRTSSILHHTSRDDPVAVPSRLFVSRTRALFLRFHCASVNTEQLDWGYSLYRFCHRIYSACRRASYLSWRTH